MNINTTITAVVCSAVFFVGVIEIVYQIYHITVTDAKSREERKPLVSDCSSQ